jgi:cobyrinic acid a,c-diamide synthase
LRRKGLSVSAFKKGPDYIDSAWLGGAAESSCRNLDTYLVTPENVYGNFVKHAAGGDLALIEGNRGIFDGKDVAGTHSTAVLAKLLAAPVILVINATKLTRTAAVLVKGCLEFEPDLKIAGVIINKLGGERHKNIISEAIEKYCRLPVLGAIPRLESDSTIIPGRHLGLVPPAEFGNIEGLENRLFEIAERHIDIKALVKIAESAEPLEIPESEPPFTRSARVKIGFFRDSIFTFYYPENLEALKGNGAELVGVSSIEDEQLPEIDALYIGGGFPETQAEHLAENKSMMSAVKKAAEDGMPIYAECGGLIYLSKSIIWKDKLYPMAGLFPIDLKMNLSPAGHGYSMLTVDRPNPFFETGHIIKGHEFHYSSRLPVVEKIETCFRVDSGTGLGAGRDGLLFNNALACYTHIHADGEKRWADSMVAGALEYKSRRLRGVSQNFNNGRRDPAAA